MNAAIQLPRRQAEVTEYIAWGATKKEVANILHCSVRTIENTLRIVYIKIGVTKVNELSAWWFCTHFHIPMTLSPLIRRTVAIALLGLFSTCINLESNNLYMRARRLEQMSVRPRRSEDVYLITA